MNFKYVNSFSEDEATILLYDRIGNGVDEFGNAVYGISGVAFANEILYLQDKVKKINVRINSVGGSVLEGYSIVSAILNSKVPCDTYIDGLAASISGVIAVCGKKMYMTDYSTLMVHNPSGGEDKEVLSIVKQTLVNIFTQRTSLNEIEISEMMDKETWLTADDCYNLGVCDNVLISKKKVKVDMSKGVSNMAKIFNELIIKQNKMKGINKILNIAEDTEEVVTESTVEAIVKENEDLKSKLDSYVKQEELAKEKAETELKEKATEMIENAVKAGKINESEKENTISLAIANYSLVENMISKINNVTNAVRVFDVKNTASNGREDWTIRDWEKKDPSGLIKLQNETPELYSEMYNSFYKKQTI